MSESENRVDDEAAEVEQLLGEGEPVAEAPEVEAESEELARARAEAAEYLDQWRRSVAELSNARKRMLREQEEMRSLAAARVLEKLLPIIDDMDRAFAALPPEQAQSDWAEGFRAIGRKLDAVLQSEAVTPIPTDNQPFDPELHYAVSHEEVEGYSEGQIIGEVARGYRLGDRILRPSMVRVAKGS